MDKFIKKNLSLISFLLIPIIFFWNPNWIGILGIQPYWPLFWLLPWAMIYGPANGLIIGLFLGLILDSITPESYTQIPGLIICGVWFGKVSKNDNVFVEHFRNGLICSIGSFACGTLYFLHRSRAILSKKLVSGSPPPLLTALATSWSALVYTCDFALSAAPFLAAIFADFLPI